MQIDWVDNIGTITGITSCGKYVFLDSQGSWRVVRESNTSDLDNAWFSINCSNKKNGRWRTGDAPPNLETHIGWQSMDTAPKDGTKIEVLLYHASRQFARMEEKRKWEAVVEARWTVHNGGGWVWSGMHGEFMGWRK